MKSFSELTKEELVREENPNSCCDSAEFLGLLLFGCTISATEIKFTCENRNVFERFNFLAHKHKIKRNIMISQDAARYTSNVSDKDCINTILKKFYLVDENGLIRYRITNEFKDCCKNALIRGAFLGGGTIINPSKNYNLEIVTAYMGLKDSFLEVLSQIGFSFKVAVRKSKYVIYSKQSDIITDFLNFVGAVNAQMELINIKIEKEIKNNFNRTANGETANIEKTIGAAVEQIKAIDIIDKQIGIDGLPDELRDLAILRLNNRSLSLLELGKLLNPPLGKSGVNHRFKKIIAISKRLAEE